MSDRIHEEFPLTQHNTLRLNVKSRYFTEVRDEEALRDALRFADRESLGVFILGEGSNVLFRDDFEGLTVKVDFRGISVEPLADGAIVTAAAGENWHGLVEYCLARELYGIENLALIPGSVGAAPVQNIGAYGAELSEVLADLRILDRRTLEVRTLTREECRFGYRHSIFREPSGAGSIITSVRLRLAAESPRNLSYEPVRRELERMGVADPGGREIAQAVCRIRRRRLPDPARTGNVGSFFKNPIVTSEVARALGRDHEDMPLTATESGDVKLPAAWLIDQCGLKGTAVGGAAVSEQHALVLVNRGDARPGDFVELATLIQNRVSARFGVQLELEPTLC